MNLSPRDIDRLRASSRKALEEAGFLRSAVSPSPQRKIAFMRDVAISTGHTPRCVTCGAVLSATNKAIQCFSCLDRRPVGSDPGSQLKTLVAACLAAHDARDARTVRHRLAENEEPEQAPAKAVKRKRGRHHDATSS